MATPCRTRPIVLTGLALIGTFMFVATGSSFAQDKKKASWSAGAENTKYTVQHSLEVMDVPGHLIRFFEIRRTYPDKPPTIDGLKAVEDISRGTADVITGNGRAWGYGHWRFENGDLAHWQWQNTIQTVVNSDSSRRTTVAGTLLVTGGTGKLRTLKGVGRYGGVVELKPDGTAVTNEISTELEYWFDK